MKLKQIQQFNADKFEGDIFSYIRNIPEQKLQVIAVAVFKSNDDEEIQSVFRGIEKILESDYKISPTLEARLAALNNILRTKIKRNILNNFACAIVEIKDSNIYLTSTGDAAVLIVRNQKMLNPVGSEEASKENVFSSFTSGKLETGDKIIVTTKNLTSLISVDNLLKIINTHELDEAVSRINEITNGTNIYSQPVLSIFAGQKDVRRTGPSKSDIGITALIKKYKSQLTLFLALLLLVLTVTYIARATVTQTSVSENQALFTKFEQIDKSLTQGEAALIYKDKSRVDEILGQAQGLLNQTKGDSQKNPEAILKWSDLNLRFQKLSKQAKQLK